MALQASVEGVSSGKMGRELGCGRRHWLGWGQRLEGAQARLVEVGL